MASMLRVVTDTEPSASTTDFYYDPLPGPDFAQALHSLRKRGQVVPASALGGALPIFYIVGYEALAEAFRDGERFPPHHAYQIISQPFIGETFMSMAPDRHRLWRPAMTPAFRRATVERLADAELAGVAHELIDRVEAAGRGDLVRNFTRLFAFAIICRQLGLPRDHEDEFYDWSMDLMFGGRDLEKSRAADAKLTAFVTPVLEAPRRDASPVLERPARGKEIPGGLSRGLGHPRGVRRAECEWSADLALVRKASGRGAFATRRRIAALGDQCQSLRRHQRDLSTRKERRTPGRFRPTYRPQPRGSADQCHIGRRTGAPLRSLRNRCHRLDLDPIRARRDAPRAPPKNRRDGRIEATAQRSQRHPNQPANCGTNRQQRHIHPGKPGYATQQY